MRLEYLASGLVRFFPSTHRAMVVVGSMVVACGTSTPVALQSVAPPQGAEEGESHTGEAGEESRDWSLPKLPPGAAVVPGDWVPVAMDGLPTSTDEAFCLPLSNAQQSCPEDLETRLVQIFTESPAVVQAWDKCDTYCALDQSGRSEAALELLKLERVGRGGDIQLGPDELRRAAERKKVLKARIAEEANKPILIPDTGKRRRPSVPRRRERDRELAELAGCPGIPRGWLENLRAELLPECTETLARRLDEQALGGQWRAEMELRRIAVRVRRRELKLHKIPGWLSPDEFLKRFKRDLEPRFAKEARDLREIRDHVLRLPDVPSTPLALSTIQWKLLNLMRANRAIPKSAEKDYEVRTRIYGGLEDLDVGDGQSLYDLLHQVRRQARESLAKQGAFATSAALLSREWTHVATTFLRAKVEPPEAASNTSRALLPAPHFAELFPPQTEAEAMESFRGGFSPVQIHDLHERLADDPESRALRRALGEQHLARALLFFSPPEAGIAYRLLEPLAETDHQRVDVGLAYGLSLHEGNVVNEWERHRLPEFRLMDPVAYARQEMNRRDGVERLRAQLRGAAKLRPAEQACVRDTLMFQQCEDECDPFSWMWNVSVVEPKYLKVP